MDKPRLRTGSVPVRIAAMVYGKDAAWVRAGIIAGWLPIGEATRNGVKITDIKQMIPSMDESTIIFRPNSYMNRPGLYGRESDATRKAGTIHEKPIPSLATSLL